MLCDCYSYVLSVICYLIKLCCKNGGNEQMSLIFALSLFNLSENRLKSPGEIMGCPNELLWSRLGPSSWCPGSSNEWMESHTDYEAQFCMYVNVLHNNIEQFKHNVNIYMELNTFIY